jgi:hypothetical protein
MDGGLPDGGAHDYSGGVAGEAALAGIRYAELCELAGGIFGSICDCSFDTTLDELGLEALGLRDKFLLSRPADPTTLVVQVTYPCSTVDPADNLICTTLTSTCVGGLGTSCTSGCDAFGLTCTVPQANPDAGVTDGWTYSVSDNSLLFSSSTEPGPGSQVSVGYTVDGAEP